MSKCWRIRLIACLVMGVILSGCVEADLRTLSRYDATNDSFVFLCSYTNVRAETKDEIDHLISLWNRRESILPIAGWFAAERRGPHGISFFEIGKPKDAPDVQRLNTDLDSVKINSGEFHLNRHGSLSYYTQITVPGLTIDSILDEKRTLISEALRQYAEQLVKKATDVKNDKATWNKTRQDLLTKMLRKPSDPEVPYKSREGEELPPYDELSLRNFIRAGADNSFTITRSKDVLSCIIPLSQADCYEAMATLTVVKENMTIALERHKGQSDEAQLVLQAGLLNAIEVMFVPNSGLEVRLNLSLLAPCLNRLMMADYEPAPKEKDEIVCKTTVAAVAGRGIIVNKQFSIRKLTSEFPVK